MARYATPPSKPDGRISRIRLSSQWVLLREGAALRLVPKNAVRTFGAYQVNCTWLSPPPVSPCGHSRRFFVRRSIRHSSTFLRSLRSTVVTRFLATTDALTPASRLHGLFALCILQHWRVSLITAKGTSNHSVSNHRSAVRGPPGCPAIRLFTYRPLCRLRLSLADSPIHPDRIEFTATAHSDRLCYGLVVLVPLLPTPHCCDAVTVRYRTIHFFGFAETQWKLFLKESPRRVKPLLYVYRVLLTGIHLMRTGEVQANLVILNEEFRLPYIANLAARKLSGPEKSKLEDADIAFHETEYQRLRAELQTAHESSHLPGLPDEKTRAALNDLLIRIRLAPPQTRPRDGS